MEDRRTKRGLRSRNADRSEDEKGARLGSGQATGGGGIFKSAAVAVLRQHRKLMTTGDITRLAVEMGLLKCQGKTPEATMASALYTDVKRKLHKSLFTRPQEGLFGLREWLEEGYYPEGWVGPPDGLGLAPFKRRNTVGAQQGSGGGASSVGKASRQGVRTGPGRSSKSRAARSWRSAASDAEDEDFLDDEEDPMLTSRPGAGSFGAAGGAGGYLGAGDEEEGDEGYGEGEDGEDEEVDDGEDGGTDGTGDGLEEHGREERRLAGGEGGAAVEGQAQAGGAAKEATSSMHPHAGLASGRRGGKGRAAGGAGEAMLPQDECLSPLHMLGEAAASESMGDLAAAAEEAHGTPPAKRKRPSSIMVPERGGGLGGVEGITPKSPYEDSLAALHEIATSPSTFDLTSQREQQREREGGVGSREGGGKLGGRQRPRLQVDVPGHGGELGGGPGSRREGGTPGTTQLADNPMLQGETTPAILLQASPVTTASGQQAMVLRQAPVLVTLPPALASPSAAGMGQLDTPALLHVQLPGGTPSELVQTTLITPTGQPLSPFRPHPGGSSGPAGRGGLLRADGGSGATRPPGRRVSFSGQVGVLGPPPPSLGTPVQQQQSMQQPPTHGSGGGGGPASASQAWPPNLTPEQVQSELAEITRMQTVVERLESKLGNTHPQVGKAWLALSRMYQHVAEAERNNGGTGSTNMAKAAAAVKRAWAVCRACAESCGTSLQCDDSFRYLTNRTSEAAVEPAAPAEAPQAPAGVPAAGDMDTAPAAAAAAGKAANTIGQDGQGGSSASPVQEGSGGGAVGAAGEGGAGSQQPEEPSQTAAAVPGEGNGVGVGVEEEGKQSPPVDAMEE
ncbi:hypothetical protein Agub_g620 [Astrephomene gubernaculifera]|uniref:HTH HARE-type domain-containing protein n=1 Tax=Astrephomene gubernaculifera TaxID=47775 RepID=A0AAD3DDZ2_9CHLO|nr:hypothetical protein Agub_g620 [Astrephomene gubernaculifera]